MANVLPYSINDLTIGGGTLNLPTGIGTTFTSDGIEQVYFLTCSTTIAASWVVQASGTLAAGLQYRIVYDGTSGTVVTTATNTITIFGVVLTQAQANSLVEIVVDYDTASTYKTHIATSENNKATTNPGIKDTTLTSGGGTITLVPSVDKAVQYYSGTATLAGSWVITASAPASSTTFWIYYNAALTVGANSVTIFGLALTAAEALAGGVSIKVDYDSNSSSYRAQKITGAGTSAITQAHVVYFDTVNGSNATGTVNRLDLPYLTYAAAATAALALSPNTTTNVVWIEGRGYMTEAITLYNGINVDIRKCDQNVAAGNSTHSISDAGAATTSVVLANNITRSGTGTGGVYAIATSNSSSNVIVYANDITSSTTTSTDAAIAGVTGTLTVRCNDITAYNFGIGTSAGITNVYYKNITSSNSSCITTSGGTQNTFGNNVTSALKNGFAQTGGTQYGVCNTVTASGSSASGSCIASSAGTQTIICAGITMNNTASQAIYATGAAIQMIKCKGTILGSSYIGAIVAESLTGSQIVHAELMQAGAIVINTLNSATTGYCEYKGRIKNTGAGVAVDIQSGAASITILETDQCESANGQCLTVASANNTAAIRLKGRFVAVGTNKDCIVTTGGASSPDLIIEGGTTLVSTGAGASIISGVAATVVKVYTGVVGNVAVDGNITQQVGTVTVSSNVI